MRAKRSPVVPLAGQHVADQRHAYLNRAAIGLYRKRPRIQWSGTGSGKARSRSLEWSLAAGSLDSRATLACSPPLGAASKFPAPGAHACR